MARRRIAEEPPSRLAIWARRCALFSLAATLIAILIMRAGLLEIEPALATLAAALGFAAFAILLALGSFISIWKDGIGGGGMAFASIGIGAALLGYPAYLFARASQLPAINDVTTDALDPPRFDVIARLRPRGTSDYPGLHVAQQQRIAYPDIEPLAVSSNPQIAYEVALGLINKRKWRVVVDRPPQANRRDGQIEAVARSPVLGFRDDVAVRVRSTPDGARVDVRSASRYGKHDIGANAQRVRALLEEIDDGVSAKTDEPRPAPKPASKKGVATSKK